MRNFLILIFALSPTLALSHPGHTETVMGHTHLVGELLVPFLAITGVAIAIAVRLKSND